MLAFPVDAPLKPSDNLLNLSDDNVKRTFDEHEAEYHFEFLGWYQTHQDEYNRVVRNPNDLIKLLVDAFPNQEKGRCFFNWYEKCVGRSLVARASPLEPQQLINAVATTNFLV
ncbi:hypothetical protein ACHAPT_012261 [Fusarium lateritium]